MRICKLGLVIPFLLFLGACSTNISVKKPFESGVQQDLKISEILVDAETFKLVTPTLATSLKSAVLKQLATKNGYGQMANLEILVTKAYFVPSGDRLLMGAFAGSDLLYVTATVKSQADDTVLAVFEINGEYNPGGFGVFSDAETAAAENVAETLVGKIFEQ